MKAFIMLPLLWFTLTVAADARIPEIRETLKWVESNHNPLALGDYVDGIPTSYGILQIQRAAVIDVNRKYGTSYSHEDAFDVKCAEEIFALYIQMWSEHLEKTENRAATIQDMVRIWNGGPRGYKKKSTLKYYRKFLRFDNYPYLYTMKENKQQCIINGKLGHVTARYTHTMDIYLFKDKKHMYGVHRRYIHLLPMEKSPKDPNQLQISYEG